MDTSKLYNDIGKRTAGDIYIGVVGPVRTGKSTFIKRFMETLIVPNISNDFQKQRAVDELPQSAAGRTIMTAEPKFIPDEAVKVELSGGASLRVKMIDCVGYIVPSALGDIEDDMPRMVMTPWFAEPVPFNMAAEIGTQKVITDHSTIGVVITTDGSFGELAREEFIEAQDRVINELKAIDKPFVVVVNSRTPASAQAQAVVEEISAAHDVPVLACNCTELDETDIKQILETVLFEFPIKEIGVNIPSWIEALEDQSPIKRSFLDSVMDAVLPQGKIKNIADYTAQVGANEYITECTVGNVDLGCGSALIDVSVPAHLFYDVLSEKAATAIPDDGALMRTVVELCALRGKFEKYAEAIEQAQTTGYGVVMPCREDLTLEEPELIKQEGRYGVRLKASAPSIHVIKADIQTQVAPIVGTESQSEEFVAHLMKEFKDSPARVWESDIFGKSLYDLVDDGLRGKLYNMPAEARDKYKETLERIINEGSDGLICIIL